MSPLGFLLRLTIIVLIIVGIFVLKDFRDRKYAKKLYNITTNYIFKNVGPNIAITAKVRAGKTTSASAITHVLTLKLKQDILEKRELMQNVILTINYLTLDNDILSMHPKVSNNKFNTCQVVTSTLLEKYKEHLFRTKEDGTTVNIYYNDHINLRSFVELFKTYVEATYWNIENNFVMSNVTIRSRITNTESIDLKNEFIELKNQYRDNYFFLRRYCVFVYDETGVFNDKRSENWQSAANADSGTSIFYSLTGHIFKETSYTINIIQNFERWLKSERELNSVIFEPTGFKIIGNLKFYDKLLNFVSAVLNLLMRIRMKFMKKYKRENYYYSPNRFKRLQLKILDLRNLNLSESYLSYKFKVYKKASYLNKTKNEEDPYYDEFDFVFPITYCWGTVDTHYYSFLYDQLLVNAKRGYQDLSDLNFVESYEEKTKRILEQKMRETSSKTSTINVSQLTDSFEEEGYL